MKNIGIVNISVGIEMFGMVTEKACGAEPEQLLMEKRALVPVL